LEKYGENLEKTLEKSRGFFKNIGKILRKKIYLKTLKESVENFEKTWENLRKFWENLRKFWENLIQILR
jgi:hypothetical protein